MRVSNPVVLLIIHALNRYKYSAHWTPGHLLTEKDSVLFSITVTVASVNELIIDEDMATVQEYLKNDEWVKRIDGIFATFDADKDGYVSAEDWMITANNLEKSASDRPDAIAELRQAIMEFTTATGLTEGVKVDKKKYRELLAAFFLAEAERMERGEMALLKKFITALFDFIDKDRNGYITFEEYKLWMDASNFGEEAAKATFNLLDKNKNGKIDRNEYLSYNLRFWCTLDDPDSKGMFGARFE